MMSQGYFFFYNVPGAEKESQDYLGIRALKWGSLQLPDSDLES
jgi:hypothetical protein